MAHLALRLFDATRAGDTALMQSCLPNLPEDSRVETLNAAAVLAIPGDMMEALKILLNAGVSPESKDDSGRSLACLAAAKDAFACLQLLHERGAALHTPGKDGDLPAHIAARQMSLGCLEVLRAANADFLAKNPCGESPLGLLLSASKNMPTAECFLIEVLKNLPLSQPSSGESSEATRGADKSESDFEQLLRLIGSDTDLLALILNYSPLTEANALRLMGLWNFHEDRRLPAYKRRHYFDFVALLENNQAPGVGRRILEKICFEHLLDWAADYPARLQFILEQAPLDFDAVRRIIRHPQFMGVPSIRRNWFEDSSIDPNPHAKGLIERFFNETPMPELVSWVGNSRRRLKFLSGQVEMPGELWADFIHDRLFDVLDLDGDGSAPAIHRFLTETPSPNLLAWAKDDENRTAALLRRARLDDDVWVIVLTDPAMTKMRLNPLDPFGEDYSWPPLITLALENPHLPPTIRDALNASLATP